MRIELVSTFCRFAELRDDWNRLADGIPMRSWEWAYTWAETMLGDGKLMLFVGKDDDDRVVGIAPFYLSSHWLRGDVIRFLGDRQCCTDYTTILAHPDHTDVFLEKVARSLAENSVGHTLTNLDLLTSESNVWLGWDLIHLEGIDQSDAVMKQFIQQMSGEDCTVNWRSTYSSWQTTFNGTWEEYVSGLSKSQRRNVRLVQRRLLDAEDVAVHEATDSQSLAYGMKWFRVLHQKRWESEGKPGCFANPEFATFLYQIAERLFDNGSLRVLWIEKSGTPIGVDFSFLSETTSYGYQMGIDPEFRDQEIGRALLVAAMKSTHQSGRVNFDFLRGDERYKSRWGGAARPLLDVEIVPDRSLPQLRQNLVDFGRGVKQRLTRSE